MPWPDLLALLAFMTAMAFTPGPNTTLSTALAANHGLARAMRFVCAVPVGWGVMFVLCVAGLGAWVTSAPLLRLALKVVGTGYLLWLALRLWRTHVLHNAAAEGLHVGFWQGVALQFANIKAWMVALTVTAGWVATAAEPVQRAGWVLPVVLAYAFASNFTYALVGASLRGWLAQGERLRWFNRAMAVVLVLTAAWMAMA